MNYLKEFINNTMKPKFPIVQIEFIKWDLDLMAELFRYDEFYYSKNVSIYKNYISNKRFLDSNGSIFVAKKLLPVKSIFSNLGFGKKYIIEFEIYNEEWTFKEVKDYLVSKIIHLSNENAQDQWLKSLENAKTIKELIEAKR